MSKTIEISRSRLESWYRQMRDLGLQKLPDEIMEYLAAPVVERQEPVAWMYTAIDIPESEPFRTLVRISRWDDIISDQRFSETPLYTSPPAPVAVVLPTHQEIHILISKAARQADLTAGANYFTAAEFAAIELLDKVKELNQ